MKIVDLNQGASRAAMKSASKVDISITENTGSRGQRLKHNKPSRSPARGETFKAIGDGKYDFRQWHAL